MKLTGILPLRNGSILGYPFDMAIRSLQRACDEVIVGVDPGEDDTLDRVRAIGCNVVETRWDMSNHNGHHNCEISVQTQRLCDMVTDGWVLSLQADEVIHEGEAENLRECVKVCEASNVTGVEMERLYFYGSLATMRTDWTIWMVRLFKAGTWTPDVDGAMRFNPSGHQQRVRFHGGHIWHYSRMGDPALVAERVRNLDRFFHAPDRVAGGAIPAYDFGTVRKLDTYVHGAPTEDAGAVLEPFIVSHHPAEARRLFA